MSLLVSRLKFLLPLLLASALLFSCKNEKSDRLVIGDNFYYWETTAESTIQDAISHHEDFKKLEDKTEHNLMNQFGRNRRYLWIRSEFEIPEAFKNVPLGLVIPHLRSAEMLFCNGSFISLYGAFPPNEHSTQYMAHFFSLPVNILNQEGTNTILIKVFIQGDSGISSHTFIQNAAKAYNSYERINFWHSRVYILLFGVMFFTFFLYLCLYISLKNFGFKVYLDFSLLNFFTSLVLFYFFAPEVPFYIEGKLSHLAFAKFSFCIPGYVMIYLITRFATNFYGIKTPLFLRIARNVIVLVQVVPTFFATSYAFLLDVSPFMMTLVMIQAGSGLYELVKYSIVRETRKKALLFALGFLPFTAGAISDAVVRVLDPTQAYPYFMIFGWQGTIIAFIVMLSVRFGLLYRSNERLTNHLQEEVDERTGELKKANDELSVLYKKLEKEKHRSDMDLEMAFFVQKNFFPQPSRRFRGWELSVCYVPQAKVSGDLYDFYSYNDILNGVALFDVSGHGLSAGLVTMLSKNIISRLFQRGYRTREPIDKILTRINNSIIYEKGDISNYMTGILCRFENIEGSDECIVDLGNAGHPYPLLFNKKENSIGEVVSKDGKPHYGAIGMKGIEVSFASSNFSMKTGDILVIFTDGITESTDSKNEQFGTARLKEIIKKNCECPASEISEAIMNELVRYVGDKAFDDDVSLIVAKRVDPSEDVVYEQDDEDAEAIVEELKAVD